MVPPAPIIKSVIYHSCKPVVCEKDIDIYICVDSSLTATGAPYIIGQITEALCNRGACGDIIYDTYVSYDALQLLDPESSILSSDIKGFVCDSCLMSIIDWKLQNLLPS